MKLRILRLLIIFISFTVAGCADFMGIARGPRFEPAQISYEQGTTVYIYRPFVFKGGGSAPYIFVDNRKVVMLTSMGYTKLLLSPGRHNLQIKKSPRYIKRELSFDFEIPENNKEAYIRIAIPKGNLSEVIQFAGNLILISGGATQGIYIPTGDSLVPNSDYTVSSVSEDKALEEISHCRYIKPETDNFVENPDGDD